MNRPTTITGFTGHVSVLELARFLNTQLPADPRVGDAGTCFYPPRENPPFLYIEWRVAPKPDGTFSRFDHVVEATSRRATDEDRRREKTLLEKTLDERSADDWLLVARNRADRLARLCSLNAPEIIIEREYAMLGEAMEGWRAKSGHDYNAMIAERAADNRGEDDGRA